MAEFDVVKGSLLPAAAVVNNGDNFFCIQGGVTKILPFAVVSSLLAQGSVYNGTFTNSNLVDGVLTINHELDVDNALAFVFDPAGEFQPNVPYTRVDNDNLSINFGGPGSSITAGTWKYMILFWKGSVAAAYPDPTYALATQIPVASAVAFSTVDGAGGFTVLASSFDQYGALVSGSLKFTSAYGDSTERRIGNITTVGARPFAQKEINGNSKTITDYEGGVTGYVDTDGDIFVATGKGGKTYSLSFNYIVRP